LLETGDLRDSIERVVPHGIAYVGSNNKKALWHELGTSRIPPAGIEVVGPPPRKYGTR
jgi:phage gpG-like protein